MQGRPRTEPQRSACRSRRELAPSRLFRYGRAVRFVDECTLRVEAGAGGNGCAAFRRESLVPFGGPAGGDGGQGGSVIFVGDEGKTSLLDLTHVRKIQAEKGENGKGKDKYGRGGEDERVRIPVGTIVRDHDTGEALGEVVAHGQELVVARGGQGGRGNKHFATPTDRAPRKFEPGEPGEARNVDLELQVMADVGLLGFPNVGKSTFVATVSHARPKIADYPFTTLVPQLGMVRLEDFNIHGRADAFVVADIPGLIPGASEGAGLGARFLRHVERTRVLLHLVTIDPGEGRDPLSDYQTIRSELAAFDPELAQRPELVVLSKLDADEVSEAAEATTERFRELGIELLQMSCLHRTGVREVLLRLEQMLSDPGR